MKFIEDVGYDGRASRDAHTEDDEGVRGSRGCMRVAILRERGQRWNAGADVQAILAELNRTHGAPSLARYSPAGRDALLAAPLDRIALATERLAYERLDQLTIEVLLGVR